MTTRESDGAAAQTPVSGLASQTPVFGLASQTPVFDLPRLQAETPVREIVYRPVMDSTNTLALSLTADAAQAMPLLVLAGEQTAGRGRNTNRWWSSAGALTFSLVIEPGTWNLARDRWPRIALTAGLSVCQVVRDVAPQAACGLKWPNDVLLGSWKLCGILVEVPPPAGDVPRIVIGLGINVNNSTDAAPDDVRSRAISLRDATGTDFDMTDILARLLRALFGNLQALASDADWLSGAWAKLCVLTGKTVTIQRGEKLLRGRCSGIDAQGALVLETAYGRERIFGGTVAGIEA